MSQCRPSPHPAPQGLFSQKPVSVLQTWPTPSQMAKQPPWARLTAEPIIPHATSAAAPEAFVLLHPS
jgi:hypothetical protein